MPKYSLAPLLLIQLLSAADIDTLRLRLFSDYVAGNAGAAMTHSGTQQTDGSWTDINYASRVRTAWPPVAHLDRLKLMALAYNQPTHAGYRSTTLLSGIQRGLTYWYAGGFQSDNWWYNDIGQQLVLGPLLILMQGHITQGRIDTGSTYLRNPGMTGQNLVWLASETVQRGVLRQSVADVNLGINAIQSEIVVSNGEGIQSDFSFHQHGPQLYNSGYGSGFLSYSCYWMHMVNGLTFGFTPAKIDIIANYALSGTQWMVRRGNYDPSCQGREISRPNSGSASGISLSLDYLMESLPARTTEFQAFKNHLQGASDGSLVGNRHFWRSDYMTHRRAGFLAGVHLCSRRTIGAELVNSENQKAFYFPFGFSPVLIRGNEYQNIYPVWDWARIPGVTSPHKTPPPMPNYQRGTTDFVGGVSDGNHGMAVLDLSIDGVTGRKSWFFFDREVVALGAGILSSGADSVFTSINQTFARGSIYSATGAGAGTLIPAGTTTLVSPLWVNHDSVGYVFPQPGAVILRSAAQTGTWASINPTYSTATVTENVFSLWINHGLRPQGASYVYALVPAISPSALPAYSIAIPFTVVSNTSVLQAVRHDGLLATGAAFYAAGQVDLGSGTVLTVNQPCLTFSRVQGAAVAVTISNPTATGLTVQAEVLQNNVSRGRLNFALPGDTADAGRSVTQTFGTVGIGKGSLQSAKSPLKPIQRISGSLEIGSTEGTSRTMDGRLRPKASRRTSEKNPGANK